MKLTMDIIDKILELAEYCDKEGLELFLYTGMNYSDILHIKDITTGKAAVSFDCTIENINEYLNYRK